jgi:CDGSH-type Zn-finger protein
MVLGPGTHALCSCGLSRQGVFCDGAHLGTGRVAYMLELREETSVAICGCGRSHRYPLCDGTHEKVSRRKQKQRPWWMFW